MALMVLLVSGLVVRPVEQSILLEYDDSLKDPQGTLRGGVLGLLSGFNSVTAGLLWIRAHAYWEKRDAMNTERMIRLVTEVDPHNLFYWLNGVRMITHDVPVWRMCAMNDYAPSIESSVFIEQADKGLALLEEALRFHPGDPHLLREREWIKKLREERER